ncbi:MAG: c-type cytochrome [Gammaproteobacteria bacterium]
MKAFTAFLMIASVAGLAACGKSDEAAAPSSETPAAVAPPAEAPAEAAAPAVEAVEPPAPAPVETPAPVAAPAAKAPAPATDAPAPAPAVAAPAVPSPTVADLVHGQKIYRQACAFCHDKGVAGAPKTGDATAWSARIAQGMDTLYAVAIKGKGAMPAKGGNPALSEADVNAAVDFMIAQSR